MRDERHHTHHHLRPRAKREQDAVPSTNPPTSAAVRAWLIYAMSEEQLSCFTLVRNEEILQRRRNRLPVHCVSDMLTQELPNILFQLSYLSSIASSHVGLVTVAAARKSSNSTTGARSS